jgi:hypothetical protein
MMESNVIGVAEMFWEVMTANCVVVCHWRECKFRYFRLAMLLAGLLMGLYRDKLIRSHFVPTWQEPEVDSGCQMHSGTQLLSFPFLINPILGEDTAEAEGTGKGLGTHPSARRLASGGSLD